MAEEKKSWLRRRAEEAIRGGLTRAYRTIRVEPERFLFQLRAAYGLPIITFHGVYSVEMSRLDDVAESVIRSGMRMAAAEGAGLGFGGILTIMPDLGILSAITMRTIQKLSLLYGFEMNTDDEVAELWIAAASAAGVDISRELLEKEVVNKFVPKVIQRIAARASAEVVDTAGMMSPRAPASKERLIQMGVGTRRESRHRNRTVGVHCAEDIRHGLDVDRAVLDVHADPVESEPAEDLSRGRMPNLHPRAQRDRTLEQCLEELVLH